MLLAKKARTPSSANAKGGTTSQVSGLDCASQIYWEDWGGTGRLGDWEIVGLRDCEIVRLRYAPGKMVRKYTP